MSTTACDPGVPAVDSFPGRSPAQTRARGKRGYEAILIAMETNYW